MEKRHKHVSPTLDIMAKKIFEGIWTEPVSYYTSPSPRDS